MLDTCEQSRVACEGFGQSQSNRFNIVANKGKELLFIGEETYVVSVLADLVQNEWVG
jgi:hypothetical protein